MGQDPVQRLQRINEAMVNLIERSRAAEREAQRAANRQPVRITDGGGLDRGAARASQNTGTTMVTGRDGKLYQQGADPTRAQPGSALDVENKKKAAAGRPEPTPGLRGQPMTAPAPAPRQAQKPAASTAPKAQGNIQMPAAAATALGQGDPAMKAYVGQLDQGDPWRGQTKKPEAKPAQSAAAPASTASTPNFVEITPEEQSRVSGENAARQAATPPAAQSKSSGLMGAANSVAGYNSNPSAAQSKSSGFNTAGMGPRTIQSLTGSETKPSQSDRGFNMGSLMMTGSTPPVITSPATSGSATPRTPKNAANLDPRFSTQPMDPDTGLPMSTTPKAVDTPKIEVGEGGPKLRPPVPQLPDSFVGNFTPPRVNTSPRAGTIQVARAAGDYSVADPSRITYGGTPGKGTAGVGKTPVDAFGRPTGATRVFGTRYDEKGNVNPQGVYGSATDVTTAKPGEALTDFENFAGQMSLTNPLTWTRPTAALNRGISDTATWLSQKFSTSGDMTPKPGADNEAGIQYGITNKSRQDYLAAERNRKQQSKIKYDMATESVNLSAPKEYNVKNKRSLESFLTGRG